MRQGDTAVPIPTSGPLTSRDLRLFRIVTGQTLEEVAPKIGVTAAYLSMLETGRRPLGPEIAIRLIRHYFPGGAQ